jgi:hypothetical protein
MKLTVHHKPYQLQWNISFKQGNLKNSVLFQPQNEEYVYLTLFFLVA